MGSLKKLFYAGLLLAALLSCFSAQAQDSKEGEPAKKSKAELKLDKAKLKKNVTTRANGDIMLRQLPDSKNFMPTMPRNLDVFFSYYFPWIDTKEVLDRYSEIDYKTVEAIFTEINTVMAKSGSRFNKLNMTESNISSRIRSGVHLLWCGADVDNFYQYISNRTGERYSSSNIEDWKKQLPKKIYKPLRTERYSPVYTNQYFIVVGINTNSSEVAILAANNMEVVQWIAFSEMKRYNLGLYEPVW